MSRLGAEPVLRASTPVRNPPAGTAALPPRVAAIARGQAARIQTLLAFLAVSLSGLNALAQDRGARLDRLDLLLHHDAAGAVRRTSDPAGWALRRADILRGMQEVMGPLPGAAKRCPLDMEVEEESDCGTFVRRRISYAAEPGGRARGFLLVPKRVLEGGPPAAGVLCLPGTDDRVGSRSIVEDGHRANRTYALELAAHGHVVLAVSYPLLADYQPDLAALGYASGTMKAIWDNIRGLDLLDSLPFVVHGRYAAVGHSLGGHNAVFTAAFDERIAVVVTNCGLDSFVDYQGGRPDVWTAGRGWCQTRYMPRLAAYRGRLAEIPFDFAEVVAAIAPRRVLVIAPQRDDNFAAGSVDTIARAARPVFALLGAAESLGVVHPDCGHDFPPEMRSLAYDTVERALRPNAAVDAAAPPR